VTPPSEHYHNTLNFRRYMYDYEASAVNMVKGASDQKTGPKVTCKVEMDVPRTCAFILRTTDCSLMEISDVDSSGNAIYVPAPGAEVFSEEMSNFQIKLCVSDAGVNLYPEDDSTLILNIKRGIVSALMVPPREETATLQLPTVHGQCSSEVTEKYRDESTSQVTMRRDLGSCEGLVHKQHTSPLALISGMNSPLSKLISAEQICDFTFDTQKRHMSTASCTETHLFLPFSHQNKYGVSTEVHTSMSLRDVSKINDRVFSYGMYFITIVYKIYELVLLGDLNKDETRAPLFRRLVLELRGLRADTARDVAVEMFELSERVTVQALLQCGTPECLSALLKVLKPYPMDAVVMGLGMLPNPSRQLLADLLEMAKYKQSKAVMYALGNVAVKLATAEGYEVPEVAAVSEFFMSILGADCSGDKELTFLTLRVIGNMGAVLEVVDPSIKGTLLKCMRQPATTLSVQLAAIQAFRRMKITDEVRRLGTGAVQKRLAAYLMLMRSYEDSDLEMVKRLLEKEQNAQVKAFIVSHVYNILTSEDQTLSKLEQVMQDAEAPQGLFAPESRNFRLPGVQGNLIFDPNSQLPREALLETTLEAFGFKMDIFELGMEGKGLEPTVDALFGKNGFFPDTISKALYWSEDKMPPKIREVLTCYLHFGCFIALKTCVFTVSGEIVRNFNKLLKDLQSSEMPDATAYLRLMGTELGHSPDEVQQEQEPSNLPAADARL
uniref:Vitellogenin domain-containing protein n=1 Tax=Periophthalmus magnuspinnatus TaxID=409849 RepID=A0A3B4AT09_9GOBI